MASEVFLAREAGTTPINAVSRSLNAQNRQAERSFTDNALNDATRRWDAMRDNNNHAEVRVSVAQFFGYNDLQREYQANLRRQQQAGHLTESACIYVIVAVHRRSRRTIVFYWCLHRC